VSNKPRTSQISQNVVPYTCLAGTVSQFSIQTLCSWEACMYPTLYGFGALYFKRGNKMEMSQPRH